MPKKKASKTTEKTGVKKLQKKTKVSQASVRERKAQTLYAYVSIPNRNYATQTGRKKYGSTSKYINHLIARDRGVKMKRTVHA